MDSRPKLLNARKLVASMPMSASRISPVRGSTTVGPMAEKALRADVIQRIDAWRMSDVLKVASFACTSTLIAFW